GHDPGALHGLGLSLRRRHDPPGAPDYTPHTGLRVSERLAASGYTVSLGLTPIDTEPACARWASARDRKSRTAGQTCSLARALASGVPPLVDRMPETGCAATMPVVGR